MLNSIQLAVLEYLLDNNEEIITDFAEDQSVSNPLATVGVGKFLVGTPENFSEMSPAQRYHYNTVIEPLVVNVSCEGMLGMHEDGTSSCQGNGFIADENLLEAYQLNNMCCEECNYTYDAWHRNNP